MDIKALYDSNSTMYVLGAILRKPDLIHESQYILSTEDFDGLHQSLFGAIYNLSVQGLTTLTPGDVDLYLRQYSTQYQRYLKENGFQYLQALSEKVDLTFELSQFDLYYNRLKKFTILRDFVRNGIDIKQFYNPDADFMHIDEENEKLNNFEITQIFDTVRQKIAVVEDKNISKTNLKAMHAGTGLKDLVEELAKSPEVGYPLDGDILNFACRGARLGKYFLYSAPTGHGKTRFMVGNACSLSMPYIDKGKVIIKDNLAPVLFIATEMDPDEIQTLILAYVSGVNEEKVLNHTYNLEEKKLIDIAVKLVEEYSTNFMIEKISDPSISTVRAKITKYILTDKIYHIFYDYIFTSPSLNMEFARTGLREDVTLMMLSNTLKELAANYGVFVMSGTQVNREWEKRQFRNENSIAGSKAIADKADFGMVAVKLIEEELESIGTLIKELNLEMPNVVIDIYKNRRGKVVNAKIYRVFDYGTCRVKDLLITDTNYKMMYGLGKIQYSYKVKDLLEVVVDNRGSN
jgi:replicative DNA helicase